MPILMLLYIMLAYLMLLAALSFFLNINQSSLFSAKYNIHFIRTQSIQAS